MNKIENVVIFAAGKGVRMAPLTQYLPKPLVQIKGEPLIERNIKFLREVNPNLEIIIVVGYHKKQFNYLKTKYKKLKLVENELYDTSNNISSLVASKKHWSNTLYVEGDLYLEKNEFFNIFKLIEQENKSIAFAQKFTMKKAEWIYKTNDQDEVLYHYLDKNAYMKNSWSGILFVNKTTSDEMKKEINQFFADPKNQQKYFEEFLWTLNNKFILKVLPNTKIHELDTFNDLKEMDSRYASHSHTLIFTPGPINNYPEVNEILAESVLHHRSDLFRFYMEETTELIKEFFETKKGMPLFITASATGAMESVVVNLVDKKDKVLLIEAGDFGKRFKVLFDRFNSKQDLTILSYDEYQTFNIEEIRKVLKSNTFDSIFITHHETSTGVLHNIELLSQSIKELAPNSLYIVDSVSSFIHEKIKFDAWGIDVALATSGKGFCVMPGLSIAVLSERAMKKAYSTDNFRFYFDYRLYDKYYRDVQSTPFTPASAILVAVNAALKVMKNQTLKAIRKERAQTYNYIKKELLKLGFIDSITDADIIHNLLVLNMPKSYDAEILRNTIEYKNNIYFELGRAERRHSQIRVGLPNVIGIPEAKLLVKAIKENLSQAKINNEE
ncbi:aminotransferase class V-fold PLP-dependent enzyme [Mycoplasmopsis gallinarum]|uniref:aminotransferase class V-fold PLP-dependent enzyme n=1 Tax=Mycoplasmopsis gallinarum TaxID=29557 RepID=UPI000481D02A|nr:aminotransferase class V-fold PLP-dependent enzyme [Mycoplasmopsis gallinarum]